MNNGAVLFFTLLLAGFYLLYCTTVTIPVQTVIHVTDKTQNGILPGVEITTGRPPCQQWHTVRKGETQWVLGKRHSSYGNTWQWIKGMRWISRKSEGDEDLKTGESVCVLWVSST